MTYDGRGIVLDDGVLFRTNENAFVQTKRKLLDECDLFCIVSLPPGTFVNAGAGVKANLLFFTRGRPTERWYYDLSHIKAVNPNARLQEDLRTPEELLDLIEAKGRAVAEAVAALRALRRAEGGTPPG